MMREIGSFEAKNRLAELLKAVERGDEVIITRRGKAVAKLVSPDGAKGGARALAAVSQIRELRRGVTLGPGVTLKALIEEDRR